jgi:hypothetical protein
MQQLKTTPVPNVLFDLYLRELKSTELKILLVIIRQTLGWVDRRALHGRKEIDWISGSQLQSKTGCSRHAISSAIEVLVKCRLIDICDHNRNQLPKASERKGKQRLFFCLSKTFHSPGDNSVENPVNPQINREANAILAQDLRKNIADLAKKLRYTKETQQN